MRNPIVNLVAAGLAVGHAVAAPITIVYFPPPGSNLPPSIASGADVLPFRLGGPAGLTRVLPPTFDKVHFDVMIHDHAATEMSALPAHPIPHEEWTWEKLDHPIMKGQTKGKPGCRNRGGAHQMSFAGRMRRLGNQLRAMLGLPLVEYHHAHVRVHHHHKPTAAEPEVTSVLSGPEDSFFYRLDLAISQLGTWEGRAVSFVIGCGLGVLIRMFIVLGIVFYRTSRGLPLRRGRCSRRRAQRQLEEAVEVAEPFLDEKAGLPEYSEVAQQKEDRYVKINGKMVKMATVIPSEKDFPPPLTAEDEWDDTNVNGVGSILRREGELIVCWCRNDSLSYEETPYELFKKRCPDSVLTYYEYVCKQNPLDHIAAVRTVIPALDDWETKIDQVEGLSLWSQGGMMVCWTPVEPYKGIQTTYYATFREKAPAALLAYYEQSIPVFDY